MKTKIILFITLLVALLSVFAFAVSAEVPEWTAMQYLDEMADKATFGADGTKATATSRVMLAHEVTDETTGETTTVYTTYPAYYICKDSTSLTMTYTEINKYTGGITFAAKNVVRLEIPKGTVTLPNQVLKAEYYPSMQTVVVPEGVTTIGSYAFKVGDSYTSSLVSVELPSTLASIGSEAFYHCYGLTELIIPEGVTAIPDNMAINATGIERLVLPSTLISIGQKSFYGALCGELVIPEGCTTIKGWAFKQAGITKVTLPTSLVEENLGTYIFTECNSLKTVISYSPIIGDYMFTECTAIETVELYNTIKIGERGFFAAADKGSITSINFPEGLTTIEGYAISRSLATSFVLPSTLETIGQYAFQQSPNLESVVILGSTTGANMFNGCSKLSKLVFTEKFDTLGSSAFNGLPSSSTIFYTGSDYERMKTLMSSLTRVSKAKFSSYEAYKAGTHTTGDYLFIYDANLCEVGFDGNHVYTGNITPTFAGQKFLSSCDFGDFCTRCNQGQIIETLPALFVNKGYAYSGDSMLQGFAVNRELLSEYEGYLGNIKFAWLLLTVAQVQALIPQTASL